MNNGRARTHRFFARVTIEFKTPFLVGSGEYDPLFDALPVVDPHGLPALPGTAISGVLRQAFKQRYLDLDEEEVFGSKSARGVSNEDLRGSSLWVSWGHIHDSNDMPVDRIVGEPIDYDEVLASAMYPGLRDRVRISHRGTAEERGKFDQSVIPAGHRFTFDMLMEGGPNDRTKFEDVLRLLYEHDVRLGRSTRSGLGRFDVVRILWGEFDLGDPGDMANYSALPKRLDRTPAGLGEYAYEHDTEKHGHSYKLKLKPMDFWAVFGAEPWLLDGEEKAPDFNPVRDVRVTWKDGKGSVTGPTMYIPGSSIKGALAHRVAFYANALNDRFADGLGREDLAALSRCPEVRELFGELKDTRDDAGKGRAGMVYIDDIWLNDGHEQQLTWNQHNSIDRFSGGTRAGVLFDERVIFKGPGIELGISIGRLEDVSGGAREALALALDDLGHARLAIGGGTGRGNGFFEAVNKEELDGVINEIKGK